MTEVSTKTSSRTQWITLILAAAVGTLALIVLPETYHPVLLTSKAKRLRHETKIWALHSLHEEKEVNFHEMLTKYILRPATMLFLEPILILVTIYIAFVFGMLAMTSQLIVSQFD